MTTRFSLRLITNRADTSAFYNKVYERYRITMLENATRRNDVAATEGGAQQDEAIKSREDTGLVVRDS